MPIVNYSLNMAALGEMPTIEINDGDQAVVFHNNYQRLMTFDASDTSPTNTSSHPYKRRPDDYSSAGVWIETAEDAPVLDGNILVAGIIKSTTWVTTTGMAISLDDSWIKMGGSQVDATGSADGVFMGLDSGVYKLFMGDTDSYFKWTSGSGWTIQLASGETFDLYGSLNVKKGGDITLESDYATGNVAQLIFDNEYGIGNHYKFYIEPSGTTNKRLYFYPETNQVGTFQVGGGPKNYFEDIYLEAYDIVQCRGFRSTDNYAKVLVDPGSSMSYVTIAAKNTASYLNELNVYAGSSNQFDFVMSGTIPVRIDTTGIRILDNMWVGLGAAAGRIEFDDQTIDEINFLDCYVGINDSTPSYFLDVNGDGRFVSHLYANANILLTGNLLNSADDDFMYISGGNSITSGALFLLYGGTHGTNPNKLYMRTANTNAIVIDASQQVGIQDSSPSYDLDVNGTARFVGKVTLSGGTDPPYVLYDRQTRDSIIAMVRKEMPPEKLGGAVLFFNETTNSLETFIPTAGVFYSITGEILQETDPITETFSYETKYYLDKWEGEIKSFQVETDAMIYQLKPDYELDKKTGKVYKDKKEVELKTALRKVKAKKD